MHRGGAGAAALDNLYVHRYLWAIGATHIYMYTYICIRASARARPPDSGARVTATVYAREPYI